MEKTNFLELEDGAIMPYQISEGKKHITLPPGIYSLGLKATGPMEYTILFAPVKQKDSLINFKGSVMEEIIGKADVFLEEKTIDVYKELKITHKMGMIIYGGYGTGKTCTSMLAMLNMVEKYKAVCIDIDCLNVETAHSAIKTIRKYQSNPIVWFSDEFDGRMRKEEERWLPILDGNQSVDDTIFIGCTNKLEDIPDRIRNRKSRIKHVIEIKGLPHEVYVEYILDRVPSLGEKLIQEFAYKAGEKHLTIDQLKNALVDYRLDKVSMTKAIKDAASTSTGAPLTKDEDKNDD